MPHTIEIGHFATILATALVGIQCLALALAVATRYKSALPAEADQAANRLLPAKAQGEARALGLALRLAEKLSCGERAVLDDSQLSAEGDRLVLRVAAGHEPLASGKAKSAADALARSIDRELALETAG